MNINSSYQPYIKEKTIDLNSEKLEQLDKKKLKKAAEGLEAEFLKIFLKESKKIIKVNKDDDNKAPGKDVMTDYMLERIAEDMSKKSPLGISKMITDFVEKDEKIKEEKAYKKENIENIND